MRSIEKYFGRVLFYVTAVIATHMSCTSRISESSAVRESKVDASISVPDPVLLPSSELIPYARLGATEAYKIQGFEVEWVKFGSDPHKQDCLKALQTALFQIKTAVPPEAYKILKSKLILFSEANTDDPAANDAFYYGNRVQITRRKEYLKRPLYITFHELAHAYDDGFVRIHKLRKEEAYESAMYRKIYGTSKTGVNEYDFKNYLTSNPEEYFAELSCAYFIGLKYFPYNRETLKEKDPNGYRLMEDAWVYQKSPNAFPDVEP
ncbi:MAG TPA: hypothetical protein PL048_09695 [Leptospiraceae bacterium]|nr:hypothetical protein [Leptospiraceae bacterium]HMY67624.1 hypothetical protein [Leptospiraceae bacterium]HMZ59037.1 hypothetical protein [Leptospiraceae bacterium]HNF14784.1 hypothetical protein [Leptospiraceae bacterium]HNF25142.1 hypothetical protein [Leptospiraceae bacterium]